MVKTKRSPRVLGILVGASRQEGMREQELALWARQQIDVLEQQNAASSTIAPARVPLLAKVLALDIP